MDSVLTLIADPRRPSLDPSTVDAARRALGDLGARVGAPDWLAPRAACDLGFAGIEPRAAQDAVAAAVAPRRIDVVAQAGRGRRKRLLVADMDATMTEGETLDELAAIAGIGPQVAAITAKAMRGEVDFATALRERMMLLRGTTEDTLLKVRDAMRPMPGARALVRTMKKHGAYTVLVSGGFTLYTGHARALIGFDEDRSNTLALADGRLTGGVVEPILGRDAKREALTGTAAARGIPIDATMAVGDGANDLDMIRAAGMGVAFHAKPVVAGAARARIDHGDLTALLYMQGYRQKEFAE